MNLYQHQADSIERTKDFNRCAYYHDMGLGKTFTGAEKMIQIGNTVNLVICQKSKVDDWVQHFRSQYECLWVFDLTKKKEFAEYTYWLKATDDSIAGQQIKIGIINYELAWRRKQLLQLHDFTLMLDESSLIQNIKAKQTKFIMKMQPSGVILLSGTPCSGKYENLVTQANLLGWNISQEIYDRTYVNWTLTPDDGSGIRHRIVDKDNPYKNVDRLKAKLRQYGADFIKTEEVIDLPEQTFIDVWVDSPKEYKKFMKDDYISLSDELELIGNSIFTKRLYARQLCSQYNKNKIEALTDLIQSTQDRLIIFYNFNAELDILKGICDAQKRPYSQVNGSVKDLSNYEELDGSISLIQYQAGAMGLNLQKCNKIIYFSLPERSELFEQSKKRIHRIGQPQPCFYYVMLAKDTVEGNIYETLKMRKDFTDDLFIVVDGGNQYSSKRY